MAPITFQPPTPHPKPGSCLSAFIIYSFSLQKIPLALFLPLVSLIRPLRLLLKESVILS